MKTIYVPRKATVYKIESGAPNIKVYKSGTIYLQENVGPRKDEVSNFSEVYFEVHVPDITKYVIGDVVSIETVNPYGE